MKNRIINGYAISSFIPENLKVPTPTAEAAPWYRIKNEAGVSPKIYIYDEISYWGITADDFVKDLAAIDADEIDLHINSGGGIVFDGLAIMNAIVNHKATFTAYNDGLAASIASVIMMGADVRIARRNSMMMIHNASGFAAGDATEFRRLADVLEKLNRTIAGEYERVTDTELDDWLAAMEAETYYTSQEAFDAGLVDKIDGQADEPENAVSAQIRNRVLDLMQL